MEITEPKSVVAYTDTGIMFPCAIIFDTMVTAQVRTPIGNNFRDTVERFRRYRVVCEVPWDRLPNVVRFDIVGWPDDVVFMWEVPGMSEGEARQWISRIPMRELPWQEPS